MHLLFVLCLRLPGQDSRRAMTALHYGKLLIDLLRSVS